MTCHRNAAGAYVLNTRHLRACIDTTCTGCQPCLTDDDGDPTHHCTARTQCPRHVGPHEQTCAHHISLTRDDLAAVVALTEGMIGEAINQGIESEAANLAGPTSNPAAVRRRQLQQPPGHLHDAPIDDTHPLFVLAEWVMLIRGHYRQKPYRRPTLADLRRYLHEHLGRIAQDPGLDWTQFAKEIAATRAHLEDVAHDGDRDERGAPCPTCNRANLVKIHLERVYDNGEVVLDPDGLAIADDIWQCPRTECADWWYDDDYRNKVEASYVEHAPKLTARQMLEVYRIKPGTLTGWATRGQVRKLGRDGNGLQLYSVADALKQRGQTTDTTTHATPA